MWLRASLCALAACSIGGTARAQDSQSAGGSTGSDGVWRLSVGGHFSTGDYGDVEDTDVISLPVGVRYTSGNFSVRVSIPYVFVDGPGSLLDTPQGGDGGGDDAGGGGGRGDSSGPGSGEVEDDDEDDDGDIDDDDDDGDGDGGVVQPVDRSRRGLGDITVTANYSLPLGGDFFLDASGRLKLPTASRADRLGTGQVDVTLGADLVREFDGGHVYAGVRRKFVGDSPTLNLRDAFGAGVGASVRAADGVSIGGDYYWQESTRAGRGDISELTGWTSLRLSDRARLVVYATTGLTTNSTDFATGATLSFRL